PVYPYVIQDFNAFLGGLLIRPGIEKAMDHGTMLNEKYQMWDIKDGTVIQEILGPDGKLFMDGLKRQDLRLAWSLSVDWFNPHGNKTSGKKKSVGEPALDDINHFLRPVVDTFLPSWKDRTWFTRTLQHTKGRCSRSVIAVMINDLPATRKLAGCVGPTANQMCRICWQTKSQIANFNYDTWKRCTCEEHR
ncbi:hypothetical protein BDR06DRAFT_867972, partial [Suillus hirtellus]